jgi:type II secretion system protein N
MGTEPKTARWKVVIGYVAFTFFSLVIGMYLTFPYDSLQELVKDGADQAGLYVKMQSLGPGLFGITATNVQLSKKIAPGEEKPPEALVIKSIALRPSLFPLGVHLSARALGGSVSGAVGGLGDLVIDLSADELDLSQGNVKGFTGADLSGKVNADISLKVPRAQLGGKGPAEPDLGGANGTISLDLKGVQINGGGIVIASFGTEPIDLPKVPVGDLGGKIKIEKGVGTFDNFAGKADGFDLQATGTVKLAKRLEYSEPNIEVRLKATPEWLEHLGPYKFGMSMLQSDPKDPSWRMGRLTGYLGRPAFR